jgi:DNA-binding PadR family transcriptional regulator
MPPRTTTSYALLGLLALRPWTTYELAKQAQRSLRWFWPRAERKLYDEPKNLVADGLASARAERTGKRPRTVYDITPQGRHELARWLDDEPAARAGDFEAMVKVFFSDSGSLDQLRATLERVEAEAQQNVRALGEMAGTPPLFPDRVHISALTLRMHLDQELSVLRWARWGRDQVDGWATTADPGDWDAQALLDVIAAEAAAETGERPAPP